MKRQCFIPDKIGNCVEQFIDSSPYLPVPVNAQVITLRSQDFFLGLETLINSGSRNKLKE